MKVLNAQTCLEARKGETIYPRVKNKESLNPYRMSNDVRPITIGRYGYKNSAARQERIRELRNRVMNADTGMDPAKLASIYGSYYEDIARLTAERPNYLDIFYNRILRPDLRGRDFKLRSLLAPVVIPKDFNGTRDLPPIMQPIEGFTQDVPLTFHGFGEERTLRESFELQEYDYYAAGSANAIANTDNEFVFDPIVNSTYDAAHTQEFLVAAAGDPAWSRSRSIYESILAGYRKIISTYYNPLTTQRLSQENIIAVNLYTTVACSLEIEALADGEIVDDFGGVAKRKPLNITNLIPYDGSPDNGKTYMGETINYTKVPADTAYLQVKTDYGAQYVLQEDWFIDYKSGQMRIEGTSSYFWKRYGKYIGSAVPTTSADGKPQGAVIKINLSA